YGQEVELCTDQADVIILNNATLEDFHKKIDEFAGLVDHTKPRDLTTTEINMQTAYSAARGSKCLKRHVGAIVVDGIGRVVAAEYNENPIGTRPCVEEERYGFRCHRDIVRIEHFASLIRRGARCPICGNLLTTSFGPPWRCVNCYEEGRKTNLEIFYFPDRA